MAAIVSFTAPYATTSGTADTINWNSPDCYSSNTIEVPARAREEHREAELKALTRLLRRAESLDACADLAWLHHNDPGPPARPGVAARPPRPTRRRTSTAVRNFRRQT